MSRSTCPFAVVAGVAGLVELQGLQRREGIRPTRDHGSFRELVVVGERVARFRVEREGPVTVVELLEEPYQPFSIG